MISLSLYNAFLAKNFTKFPDTFWLLLVQNNEVNILHLMEGEESVYESKCFFVTSPVSKIEKVKNFFKPVYKIWSVNQWCHQTWVKKEDSFVQKNKVLLKVGKTLKSDVFRLEEGFHGLKISNSFDNRLASIVLPSSDIEKMLSKIENETVLSFCIINQT